MNRVQHLLLLGVFAAGCARAPTPPKPPDLIANPRKDDVPEPARQGLTRTERDRFYHLSMGSEVVPLSWLRALESKQTGKPFLDDIERFGLLPDPDSADGLPVGLSAAPSKDARFTGKMVGMNCAACHTGEMTYQGKTVRLDGAPALFSAENFTADLVGSLIDTFKSPKKLLAFAKRQLDDNEHARQVAKARPAAHSLLGKLAGLDALQNAGNLEKAFAKRIEDFHKTELARPISGLEAGLMLNEDIDAARKKLSDFVGTIDVGDLSDLAQHEAGPDSLFAQFTDKAERGLAIGETLAHLAETMRLMKARVGFATKLAALKNLDLKMTLGGPGRVDDFGAARNLLFDPKKDARDMTAPCSIPQLWGTHHLRWSNWDGSTQSTLERSLATALAGGAVFDPATHRSTVHVRNLGELEELAKKITPPAWPEDVFGKIDRAKAERGAALYKTHCAKCHVDAKRPADLASDKDWPPDLHFDPKEIGTDPNRVANYAQPLGDRTFGAAVQDETAKYLDQACKDDKVDAAELKRHRDGHANVWRTTGKYASRPLVAIWATAPYLHNGSVPTIYDLLLPAAKRPQSFPLGQREYDPAKLGYATEVKGNAVFTFDTTLSGNRNIGHEYGTTLTDAERYELIEYLKAN